MDGKFKIVEEYMEYEVGDIKVGFNEKRKIDVETNEEIYDEDISKENDLIIYNKYRKIEGLLTSEDIKSIRKMYSLSQSEFALVLGMGEVTINRYENGTIQTKANNMVIESARDPKNMLRFINCLKNDLKPRLYEKVFNIATEKIEAERHKIMNIDFEKYHATKHSTEKIDKICDYILSKQDGEFAVTQLHLQKLLYYIQGMCLRIYNKLAFEDQIEAWDLGPVVGSVYSKYKEYGGRQIYYTGIENLMVNLNDAIKNIIDDVISDYGKHSASTLVKLTHSEKPWVDAYAKGENNVIEVESIKKYFEYIYK